ncbi:zf-HC2 domain-containing protein [Sandaracinus amylolyticus]|uniref:zf-HC2 domain-containing protein n=1 Tax=Sandaracinus amylolyticus TaxID=927083 RepID=UPI001F482B97|nr:zf-HC2 domain-containing protein [Sandaracinus amylolyticus]UJR80946.1 Fe-S oxidoreductase [Sandaracinus amylolyticus]
MTDSSEQTPLPCESVENRLLELVYGELSEREARDVRAHVSGCEGCGRSLTRLEGGRALARKMEPVEPRADLLEAVRAAARAKAAETVARASAPAEAPAAVAERRPRPSEAPAERGWWSELLRWLGSMAMGPQVAMATLLMLMIGIGLWSLPALRGRNERASTDAVVEPDPAGEVGPSRALEPAEPLAFDFDPRTRRLAPVGEEVEAPAPEAPVAPTRPGVAPVTTADRRTTTTTPAREAPEQQAVAARQPRPAGRVESEPLAGIEQDLAPGEAVGSVVDGPLPEPRAEGTTSSSAYAATEAERPPVVAPTAPPPATSAPDRYEARDEVPRPEPDSDAMLADALHRQAQAASRQGAYAECVRQYQSLLSRYPRYSDAGRALLDLAECQRRSGRIADAQRSLERAQAIPSVRADATRELTRMRMEQRAAEPPAATTSSDSP